MGAFTIRNQQVASSILAGGSIPFLFNRLEIQPEVRRAADRGKKTVEIPLRPLPPGTTIPEELLSDDIAIRYDVLEGLADMELHTLGQVVAERKFVLLTSSGSKKEVIARIGAPQESPDRQSFFCPFEIVGLGTSKIKCAFGTDAVQALRLTLKMIGVDLHHHRKQIGAGLYLFEEGDDLGFPEEAWTEGQGDGV